MTEQDSAPATPGDAKPWLQKITDAEKAFALYQDKCDSIAKVFGDLEKLSSNTGDRQLQIFWANLQVLKPAIYQRAPAPVVMPRHSDLGEVVRKAAEMLERALGFSIEDSDLHDVLMAVRDDLALHGRGVPWVLDNGEEMHLSRRDFVHEPARKWKEVSWVARAVYLTREEGVAQFGKAFKNAQFAKIGDKRDGQHSSDNDYRETDSKARVWEVWCKSSEQVYYVTEGIDTILDQSAPFIDVKGFYPCPRPAYSTLQPDTLLPVPDFVYYRDQVDEINTLTARIAALTESLRLKGFYAGGTSEIGEAIETAMKQTDNRSVLIPVSNLAALGGGALKDSIVWLPVVEVASVIRELIAQRKQLIEDVYEITGLSDIMRGATEASETLGAQQLKAQFGSIRVRDRQSEMVRVALGVIRIKAEILAEQFPIEEVAQMASMSLPTQAQVDQIIAQAQQAAAIAQAQGQPAPPMPKRPPVSLEQVDQVFKNQRLRPFLLDVETDSTIAADEQAEKSSRIEFMGVMGEFMERAQGVVAAAPETAPFLGELLKFTAGGFRAGRDLGASIDDFVETIEQRAQQSGQQDPAAMAAQMEMQMKQAELQHKQAELQLRQQEIQNRMQREMMDSQTKAYDAKTRAATKQYELLLKAEELGLKQDDQRLKEAQAEIQALLDMEELEMEHDQRRAVKIGND